MHGTGAPLRYGRSSPPSATQQVYVICRCGHRLAVGGDREQRRQWYEAHEVCQTEGTWLFVERMPVDS
jgi:hypothetical protein